MEKEIYLIRHCKAEGQPPESPLTETGLEQALELSNFFSQTEIDRIVASPFLRAIQSIEPFAKKANLKVEIDKRLSERTLSSRSLPDWLDKLEATFTDMDLQYEGGESSREAQKRIVSVIEDILASNAKSSLIVTHGNIMSLLLNFYDNEFGFEQWKNLKNPDVFLLRRIYDEITVERINLGSN